MGARSHRTGDALLCYMPGAGVRVHGSPPDAVGAARSRVTRVHHAGMRILVLLLLLGLGPWAWPVAPHEVVRAFDAPETPYGPGHRGIDIAAPAGSAVLAPQDGVVRFAGPVAGRPVLSIEHADGLVSSFEPVEPLVAAGHVVERGEQIGVLLPGHVDQTTRLHLGARLHGAYVDPLGLLGVERPVLLPLGTGKRAHATGRPRGRQADAPYRRRQARGWAVRYASASRSSETCV